MTPDQQTQLNTKLQEIAHDIRCFQIPHLSNPDDELTANETIATARMRLHLIDMELFSLYRLMEHFHDGGRQQRLQRIERQLTIDDLEI